VEALHERDLLFQISNMLTMELDHLNNMTKRIPQVLAILCICFICLIIIHKGLTDISALIQEHPDDFWRALGRYLIGNL